MALSGSELLGGLWGEAAMLKTIVLNEAEEKNSTDEGGGKKLELYHAPYPKKPDLLLTIITIHEFCSLKPLPLSLIGLNEFSWLQRIEPKQGQLHKVLIKTTQKWVINTPCNEHNIQEVKGTHQSPEPHHFSVVQGPEAFLGAC